jgi:hypothetical protein
MPLEAVPNALPAAPIKENGGIFYTFKYLPFSFC